MAVATVNNCIQALLYWERLHWGDTCMMIVHPKLPGWPHNVSHKENYAVGLTVGPKSLYVKMVSFCHECLVSGGSLATWTLNRHGMSWRLLLGENEPILFSLVWFCSFVCFRELSPIRPIMSHCSFPEHKLASFMCYSIWSLVLLSVRSIPGFPSHCLVTFVVRETRERESWWIWLLPMWSLGLHQKRYIVFVVRKLTPGNFFVICLQIAYHLKQKTLFSQSYFVDFEFDKI